MPRNLYKKVKILSLRLYPLKEMTRFKISAQRFKVQLAPLRQKSVIFKMVVLTPKFWYYIDDNILFAFGKNFDEVIRKFQTDFLILDKCHYTS